MICPHGRDLYMVAIYLIHGLASCESLFDDLAELFLCSILGR